MINLKFYKNEIVHLSINKKMIVTHIQCSCEFDSRVSKLFLFLCLGKEGMSLSSVLPSFKYILFYFLFFLFYGMSLPCRTRKQIHISIVVRISPLNQNLRSFVVKILW